MPELVIHLPVLTPQVLLEEMDYRLPQCYGDAGDTVTCILGEYRNGSLNTVNTWKNKYPWFRDKYKAIRYRFTVYERSEDDEEKLWAFLEYFRVSGKKIKSAQKAEISWATVKKRLDTNSDFFHPVFAQEYQCALDDFSAKVDDRLLKKAFKNNVPGETRVLLHLDKKFNGDMVKEKEPSRPILNIGNLIMTVQEESKLTGKVIEVEK